MQDLKIGDIKKVDLGQWFPTGASQRPGASLRNFKSVVNVLSLAFTFIGKNQKQHN